MNLEINFPLNTLARWQVWYVGNGTYQSQQTWLANQTEYTVRQK